MVIQNTFSHKMTHIMSFTFYLPVLPFCQRAEPITVTHPDGHVTLGHALRFDSEKFNICTHLGVLTSSLTSSNEAKESLKRCFWVYEVGESGGDFPSSSETALQPPKMHTEDI
uniref:Uncharacterized protein n=1 Tax=Micrurus surinamensis TaxID=129470 RepID=A0A2D4PE84_MICSU